VTTAQLVRVILWLRVIAAVALFLALFSLYMAWATR